MQGYDHQVRPVLTCEFSCLLKDIQLVLHWVVPQLTKAVCACLEVSILHRVISHTCLHALVPDTDMVLVTGLEFTSSEIVSKIHIGDAILAL